MFRAQQCHVAKINCLWQKDKNEFEFKQQSIQEYKSLPWLGKPKMADLRTLYTYGKVDPLEVLSEVWSYWVGLEKMLIHVHRMGFWSLATYFFATQLWILSLLTH